MSGQPHIRIAGPADAVPLAALAEKTFRDTFAADNTPADMDAYVRDSLSLDRIRAELADGQSVVLLAFVGGAEKPIGYAMLRKRTPPPCVPGPNPVALQRLYVDQRAMGRGASSRSGS